MTDIPEETKKLAKRIAAAHGAQIAMRKDGETLTVAALAGHGSWGHSPETYAEKKWSEYVGSARVFAEILGQGAQVSALVFPPHKASLHLTHNQHRSYYRSVEEYEFDNEEWFKGAWVSDESRAYAIAHDELWELQWYPETPIGFNTLAAGRWEDIVAHFRITEKSA